MIDTTETTELETDDSENVSEEESDNLPEPENDSEDESESEESQSEEEEVPDRLSENEAVAECCRAWHIAMKNERAKLGQGESEYEAKKEANDAFLAAMPPLSGYQNVCDFIACVTQAYMWEVIGQKRAEHLFAAAKIALGALRLKEKPASSNRKRKRQTKKAGKMEVKNF